MNNDLSRYQDLYVQTSKEYIQNLNTALLQLEKNNADKAAIDEVFRNAHSLKSQSAAMGYHSTGYLCHVIEDVFFEIKNRRLPLSTELADHLFKALDSLDMSLQRIEKDKQEIDLNEIADTLKQFAGVATVGAGKTARVLARANSSTSFQLDSKKPPTPTIPTSTIDTPSHTTLNIVAVKVETLDEILNLLGNLLLEQLKLKHTALEPTDKTALKDTIEASEKILADLQYQIMKARAVPLSLIFDHYPRAVRDLARAENKHIELVASGSDLELDRSIVEHLDEPLIHLLRNAVSHGIKTKGIITLSAVRQKDRAEISVTDNGQGIDWQQIAKKANLTGNGASAHTLKEALFSGISTSTTITQISGRGVGLTAIKKMIDDLGGSIDVVSQPQQGTTFTINVPLTLAIAKALIVTVNQKHFAIPALTVERIVFVSPSSVKKIADQETFVLNDQEVPLIRLSTRLEPIRARPTIETKEAGHIKVVITETASEKLGLAVDDVRDTIDIVIKPVPAPLKDIPGFSGVTILGNGQTALIINPQELI